MFSSGQALHTVGKNMLTSLHKKQRSNFTNLSSQLEFHLCSILFSELTYFVKSSELRQMVCLVSFLIDWLEAFYSVL